MSFMTPNVHNRDYDVVKQNSPSLPHSIQINISTIIGKVAVSNFLIMENDGVHRGRKEDLMNCITMQVSRDQIFLGISFNYKILTNFPFLVKRDD